MLLLAGILGGTLVFPHAAQRSYGMRHIPLEDVVGTNVYRAAGLHKLTLSEQEVLKEWIEEYGLHMVKSTQEDCLSGRLKKIRDR